MTHVHTRIGQKEIDAMLEPAGAGSDELRIVAVDVRGRHHVTNPRQLSPEERAAISDAAGAPLAGGAGETEIVTTAEAAGMLGCRSATVCTYVRRGVLPVRAGSGRGRKPYLIARHLVAALRRHIATGGDPYAFTFPQHA